MTVVGITGGIGSGKSSVAEIIRNEGYTVLSTDDMAKELMASDPELKKKLADVFGSEIYDTQGGLNKGLLASLVFGGTEEHTRRLGTLNSIVHPAVIDEMIRLVQIHEEQGNKMLFVESALIYEAELDEGFDYIIVVDVPEEIAIERVMKRTGATRDQVLNRMKEQMSREEKIGLADFVIDNAGDLSKLKASVDIILAIIGAI